MPVRSMPLGVPTPSLPAAVIVTLPVAFKAKLPYMSNALAVAPKGSPTVWLVPNPYTVKYSTAVGSTLIVEGPLTVMPVPARFRIVWPAFTRVILASPGLVPVKRKDVGTVGLNPSGEVAAPFTVTLIVPV